MKEILYRYDIYPKVVLEGRESTVTIQPLGAHVAFDPQKEYTLKILQVDQSNPGDYPERGGRQMLTATPDADGCLRFSARFEGESEHFIYLHKGEEERSFARLSVYSLKEDMAGRIPLRGDLHMHTCRSDGKESPAIVTANYRGHGYDFFAITDHGRYAPSLEARKAFGDLTDFNVLPGEEVHLPLNDVHYVNFGGTYSINALVNDDPAGISPEECSLDGVARAPMSREAFMNMIRERARAVPRENESERLSFAVLSWIYEQVKACDGLGIFPHPYWYCPTMQLPEDYTAFVYENAPFDAFEVLGGENYYEHNGFQTGLYYEMRAKGIDHPIVGSTDSHGSTEHNRNATLCSTIVFAKDNTREAIIAAIKDKYSVAVDTISAEYRLVGHFRLMKYGCFLLDNYFPLHDLSCRAEGYYMNRFLAGDERAEQILKAMKGQIPTMQKKYFAV